MSHADYDTFSPETNWETSPPRAITYVARGKFIASQPPAQENGDEVVIQLAGPDGNITIANIYRDPASSAIGWLPPLLPQGQGIMAGDFNLHHPRWEPGTEKTSGSDDIVAHLDNLDYELTTEIGRPTQDKGHTIDLVFSNIPGTTSVVAQHLDSTSDHRTISTIIPFSHAPAHRRKRYKYREDKIPDLRAALDTTNLPVIQQNETSLDDCADALGQTIQLAMATALNCTRTNHFPRSRIWNADCEQAHKDLIFAKRNGDDRVERNILRAALRSARNERRAKKIADATNPRDIFRITKWHSKESRIRTPAITWGDRAASTDAEKAALLRDTRLKLLENNQPQTPIPEPNPPSRLLPAWGPLTLPEVTNCLLKTTSSTPGIDDISVDVLKAIWDKIGTYVRELFQACIDVGHHPRPFKDAEVVMIPKPDKDLKTPQAYRPISLLSCLGKGLERLIARRFAHMAIKYQILHNQQFGALPKRSSTDLVGCLIHDVEKCWAIKRLATLLALDVESAFDNVLCTRLKNRLYEQGWPASLIRWVASFMKHRRGRVRVNDTATQLEPLDGGLPQGSPVSPILFMLFIAPLMHLLARSPRTQPYGYADDITILHTGPSIEDTTEEAQISLDIALDWGRQNGLPFSIAKMELTHFSRAREVQQLSLRIGDTGLTLVPKDEVKLLGIWLTAKLNFTKHAQFWAAKATRVATHLKRLSNTRRGLPPLSARQAVLACVLPVALFGAEAYYPGRTKPGSKDAEVDTMMQGLIDTLETSIRTALRAILPVWRTTPAAALHREAFIPTAEILLEAARKKHAVRIQSLDDYHPLRQRAERNRGNGQTRLGRTAALCPRIPAPVLLPNQYADWSPTAKDDAAVATVTAYIQNIPRMDLVVYSDGSKLADGRTGYGCIVYQAGIEVAKDKAGLGTSYEVYDAEIAGALAGLKAAFRSIGVRFATNVHILLDNQEAARRLLDDTPTQTSQAAILEFRRLAGTWPTRAERPPARRDLGQVLVRWAPGHVGIRGNEAADKLAKDGATLSPAPALPSYSLASAQKEAKSWKYAAFQAWWATNAPTTYVDLAIPLTKKTPTELSLPRDILGWLLAARTGHGDFRQYHERFHHEDAILQCSCKKDKTPTHFLHCTLAKRRTKILRSQTPRPTIHDVLATEKGVELFKQFVQESQFFQDICPHKLPEEL